MNIHSNNDTEKGRTVSFKNLLLIGAVIIAIVFMIWWFMTSDSRTYNSAKRDFLNDNYQTALDKFESLNNYEDSEDYVIQTKYLLGNQYLEDGDYEEAVQCFKDIEGFSDSDELLEKANGLVKQKNDQEPPALAACPDEIEARVGVPLDFTSWIASNNIVAVDVVSGQCECEVDTTGYDPNKEGEYEVTLFATDAKGNRVEKNIKVINQGVIKRWLVIEQKMGELSYTITDQFSGENDPTKLTNDMIGVYPLLNDGLSVDNINYDTNQYTYLTIDKEGQAHVSFRNDFVEVENIAGVCAIPKYDGAYIHIGEQEQAWHQFSGEMCDYYFEMNITADSPHKNGMAVLRCDELWATGETYTGYRLVNLENGSTRITTKGSIGDDEWPATFSYTIAGYLDSVASKS